MYIYIFYLISCYINHSGVKCKYETNEGDLLPDFLFPCDNKKW